MAKTSTLILLILALAFASVPPAVQGSSPISQPLVTTSSPYVWTLSSPGPPLVHGLPRGFDSQSSVTYHFLPSGGFFFTDSQGANMTVQPFQARLGLVNVTLPFASLSYNSSTVEYSLSYTLGPYSLSLSTIYSRGPGLSLAIVYTGSFSSLGLLTLSFSGKGQYRTSSNSSIMFGDEGYDWSDTVSQTPLFSNQTRTLSWSLANQFTLDPLVIDNSGSTVCNAASSCSVSITTSTVNDLILVAGRESCSSTTITISDGQSLGWTLKQPVKLVGGTRYAFQYYTVLLNQILSSDSITVSGCTGNWMVSAWAWAGENSVNPFDGKFLEADSGGVATITPASLVTASSPAQNDAIEAVFYCNAGFLSCGGPSFNFPAGWNTIISDASVYSAYFLCPCGNIGTVTVSWSSGSGNTLAWVLVADVVCNACTQSAAPSTLVTSSAGSSNQFAFNTTSIQTPVGNFTIPVQLTGPLVPILGGGLILGVLGSSQLGQFGKLSSIDWTRLFSRRRPQRRRSMI